MKYRNGRDVVIGDKVICLVPGTGLGTVAAAGADLVRLLTYEERQRGQGFSVEPIECNGRLFEPVVQEAVAADCLHLEDCGAVADVTAMRELNSKLIEELAQARIELDVARIENAKVPEDKATLSLFPEQTPTEATALPSGAIVQSPKEAEAEAEKEPGQAS